MNKTYSMSIRVSEEELSKLKKAAKLESYSSYSEFVRRIALKEANRVIKNYPKEERQKNITNEIYNMITVNELREVLRSIGFVERNDVFSNSYWIGYN